MGTLVPASRQLCASKTFASRLHLMLPPPKNPIRLAGQRITSYVAPLLLCFQGYDDLPHLQASVLPPHPNSLTKEALTSKGLIRVSHLPQEGSCISFIQQFPEQLSCTQPSSRPWKHGHAPGLLKQRLSPNSDAPYTLTQCYRFIFLKILLLFSFVGQGMIS